MRTPFTPERLAALQSNLSAERLARYLNDTGGDQVAAMELYEWNMAHSEAFYSPLQHLEVVLRNTLGNALRAKFGPDWYLRGGVSPLMYPLPDMLAKARDELTRRGIALEHGHILAELNFGFWAGLLSSRRTRCTAAGQLQLLNSVITKKGRLLSATQYVLDFRERYFAHFHFERVGQSLGHLFSWRTPICSGSLQVPRSGRS